MVARGRAATHIHFQYRFDNVQTVSDKDDFESSSQCKDFNNKLILNWAQQSWHFWTSEMENSTCTFNTTTGSGQNNNFSVPLNSSRTEDTIINSSAGPSKPIAQQILEQIEMYMFYSIAPVGIILNIICFIIFLILKNYKTSTGLHLICLAVAENLLFLSIFLRRKRTWNRYGILSFKGFSKKTMVEAGRQKKKFRN